MGQCSSKSSSDGAEIQSVPQTRSSSSNDQSQVATAAPTPAASQSGTSRKEPTIPISSSTSSNNDASSDISDLLSPSRPLPKDVDGLKSLIHSLQHALASRELTLREKEKELQAEKTQRVQSATGVLNQAMKIIRPSASASTGGTRRESMNTNSITTNTTQNNQIGISPSLIQLHEKQKEAAAEVASAGLTPPSSATTDTATSTSLVPATTSTASTQQQQHRDSTASIGGASGSREAGSSFGDEKDEESTLRRELMDVLLAFAENELIAPNAERAHGSGLTMNNESFSAVINQSSLDETTKQWLTAEFTRDQPAMGAGTRQRHVSVVNTHRSMQGDSNSASSLYANARLLISPDLISLEELESWDFDPTQYTPELLVVQSFKMFESLDLLKRFNIEPVKLSNFMLELERNYIASNPYHNFMHGMDVLHASWMMVKQTPMVSQARLRSLDLLAFMISAVCHDLGHPGTNNTYQVNTGSELAMMYNDISVLENFHVASAFRILTMPECSILQGLTREEWLDARKIIISCILATDMSHHFSMVSRLDPLFDKLERITEANKLLPPTALLPVSPLNGLPSSTDTPSPATTTTSMPRVASQENLTTNSASSASTSAPSTAVTVSAAVPVASVPVPLELTRDEITQLLNVLLHSADISNPGKPWRVAKIWGDRIQAENFAQGDLERKKNLPVSPFMDRSQENQPQTSINFIDFIVAPLLNAIVRAFPSLVPLAENLIKNRKIWHQSLLDRVSNSMRDLTGPALIAKEAERKALTNKAQIFRTCFVLPIRKIAAGQSNSNGIQSSPSPEAVSSSSHTSSSSALKKDTVGSGVVAVGASIAEGEEDDVSSRASSPPPSNPSSVPGSHAASISIPAKEGTGGTNNNGGFQIIQPASSASSAADDSALLTSSIDVIGSGSAPNSAGFSGSNYLPLSAPNLPVRAASAGGMQPSSSRSSGGGLGPIQTDERVLATADALLKSVAVIVKRRHSMLEAKGMNGTGGASTMNGNGSNLSLSQPHTPTLPRGRTGSTHYLSTGYPLHSGSSLSRDSSSSSLHLILPSTPAGPRRVSLSQMAQQMLGAGSSVTANGSSVASDEQEEDENKNNLVSPLLSPDSRAIASGLAAELAKTGVVAPVALSPSDVTTVPLAASTST